MAGIPPLLPLGRAGMWENQPAIELVSVLKERLGSAISRNNLTAEERDQLRIELNELVDVPIREYRQVPLILTRVEAIPLDAHRVIGNGGSRTHRKTLRKTLRRTRRIRTLRKNRKNRKHRKHSK